MRDAVLCLVLFAAMPTSASSNFPDHSTRLVDMSVSQRAEYLARLEGSDRAAALAEVTTAQWMELGRKTLQEIGTYQVRLLKSERVGGEVQPEQEYEALVRESPRAIHAEVVRGPATGRKILFNAAARATQMKVTECGLLGMAGGFWVDLRGTLARRESNHSIADLSIGGMLSLLAANLARADPFGGYVRERVGFNERGRWCVRFRAPAGATGLYARRSRVCVEPETGLPLEVENEDDHGFLERFIVLDVSPASAAQVKAAVEVE